MKPARIFDFISVVSLCLAAGTRAAQSPEPINTDALARIKLEASRGSQLMEVARNITTVSGPRTTNSPNIRTAGTFALKTLADYQWWKRRMAAVSERSALEDELYRPLKEYHAMLWPGQKMDRRKRYQWEKLLRTHGKKLGVSSAV